MRVLMFGRGVIATIYGYAFHQAGHDVEFYVRPGRAVEYGPELHMELVDGRRSPLGRRTQHVFSTRLRESVDPGHGVDLIVLSVGHHRLREAAEYLAPRIGEATVLIFGNVWDEPLAAVAPLPADRVMFGFPQAGGGFGYDGVLRGALLRSVILGTGASSPGQRERHVRTMFEQAGLRVKSERDMRGWLWLHFASDAGMFSQALSSGGLANMIGDRRALREAFLTSRELLPVLQRRDVVLRRHAVASLPSRLPGLTATATAWATGRFPIAQASLAAHTDPHAAVARAVLEDTLATARRFDVATPRLERAVSEMPRG
ncbi:ketopantoate reductase family protein [Mycolicibacterium tokaiense]|uniref:2-dehydropantoate 2-reductase n=1 Tax=Mycolicibacterium tokaiense TaxID=39695 RepID=A0A378TA24_9MYCO|nr:2-dehydropantoate 2-reductase N-terminal domain-containing protein [Mycolicibacterium tokaiense]BBY87862.1 ketopantoate reductase [Mycolicibacterium tokaiense]STZ57619.1 2-dehydropantoate 2-reductase [Mycolicibacterium tokaiense]